jgi:hypothetical protein
VPDIVLDYHRLKTPIDHPDYSITRSKLEAPISNVSFAYLACINKVRGCAWIGSSYLLLADWVFTDKSVFAFVQVNAVTAIVGRLSDLNHLYRHGYDPARTTSDHYIDIWTGGTTGTMLASEAIDIDNSGRGGRLSISGSVIKGMRYEIPTPVHPLSLPAPDATISATDTTYASGYYGARTLRQTYPHSGTDPASVWLLDPASELPPALAVIEVEYTTGGGGERPAEPLLSRDLVEVGELASSSALPPHLHAEAKKYEALRSRGFTEEEMALLFGYVPQRQVDLDAVTWGVFEFSEKSPTNIIIITGDNPYRRGAVQRQIEHARRRGHRVFAPPRDYGEAVALYKKLKGDFPHWLAGKDNFAYQVLGLEVLDLFQSVDFYHGELVDHRAHYQQLKQVPDWEIRSRLNELIERLSKVTVLTEERDKHINKAREILKRGW